MMNKRMINYYILAGLGVGLACAAASAAAPTTRDTGKWVNIPEKMPPSFKQADMIAVDPTNGNLYLYGWYNAVGSKLQISKDQGATWANIPCPATGSGGGYQGFNLPYPFTARMALFAGDGRSGITLDGGATWQRFEIPPHSCQWGDVDWSSHSPSVIISNSWVGANGDARSPAVSTDLGKTWNISPPLTGIWGPNVGGGNTKVGVFDSKNLFAANGNSKGLLISHDSGKTWTKTADFNALGTNPIHYGTKLYWAAAQGVMMTENGSDWKLLGTALPNATWGPYFGKSEAEMMVVTEAGVFITQDAATTWKKVAEFPKVTIKGHDATSTRFAWDPIHNMVYAIMGEDVWRLK